MWSARSLRRLVAFALAFAVPLVVSERTLLAAPELDARQMQGQELLEQGQKLEATDAKRALALYRASYDIHPDAKVLYSIGKACAKLGDAACAVASYDQYLRDGGADVPAARKKEIEGALKTLTKNLGFIALRSNVAGATVKVDGVVVGKTPLAAPLPVTAGAHAITLSAGGASAEKTIEVQKGATETVELEPVAKAKEEAAAAAPPPAAKQEEPVAKKEDEPPAAAAPEKRAVPILPWAVTGALAAGTGVSAFFMMQADSDYQGLRERYPITRGELEDAHDRGRNFLILTSVLGVATVASLGWAILKTKGRNGASDKPVGIVVGPGGVAIAGTLK